MIACTGGVSLSLILALIGLTMAGGAHDAVAASPVAPCALSERDQDPPGGTAAYNLSLSKRGTTCRLAKRVTVAFHRCRADGRASCDTRVLLRWRCRGKRTAQLPLGLPRVYDATFACTSRGRRVYGAYQENTPACFGAAARDPKRPCANTTLSVYPPSEDPYALDDGAAGCHDEASAGACVFGVPAASAKGHFALLGDSHSLHWRAALNAIARTYSWRGYSHSTGGCFFSQAVDLFAEACGDWYRGTAAWFTAHPEVSTVFVTANADTPVAVAAGQTSREIKVDGYKRAFRALPESVKHIVVLRDTPASSGPTFECLGRVLEAGTQNVGEVCALERAIALREDTAVVAARELRSPRYGVIDLTRYFCGPSTCFPVIGGVLVNGDIYGHLVVSYMRTVGPYALRAFRNLRAGWRRAR